MKLCYVADMRFILALTALIAVVPAQAADQFDLVCTGQEKVSTFGKWHSITRHYRIDVAAKTWCSDACGKTFPIQEVNPSRITFTHIVEPNNGAGTTLHWIDRVTGQWADGRFSSVSAFQTEGTCEAAPFTGFPAAKF